MQLNLVIARMFPGYKICWLCICLMCFCCDNILFHRWAWKVCIWKDFFLVLVMFSHSASIIACLTRIITQASLAVNCRLGHKNCCSVAWGSRCAHILQYRAAPVKNGAQILIICLISINFTTALWTVVWPFTEMHRLLIFKCVKMNFELIKFW